MSFRHRHSLVSGRGGGQKGVGDKKPSNPGFSYQQKKQVQKSTVPELPGTQKNNEQPQFSPSQLVSGENSTLVTLRVLYSGLTPRQQKNLHNKAKIAGYDDFMDATTSDPCLASDLIRGYLNKSQNQVLSSVLPAP